MAKCELCGYESEEISESIGVCVNCLRRNPQKALEKVIRLGLRYGGSSENTYVNIEGKKGKYMDIAAVYQRTGEKCKKCGRRIRSQKIGGRSAFWCPACQR